MKKLLGIFVAALSVVPTATLSSCNTVDDDRIPSYNVFVNLGTASLWSTYGVSAYGQARRFIIATGEPNNFSYTATSATGFGGVLLVYGFNPYSLEVMPLAYDLACPVEVKSDVRVVMQSGGESPEAVCPSCGSRFNVCEAGGTPTDGPALASKYGLRRFDVRAASFGGYVITN